jgi:hypothetical protein
MGNDLLFRYHQIRLSKVMNPISKEQSIRGAFFGAIVADALCLGSHYEYDAIKIYEAYGSQPIEKFMSPGELMGGHTHGIGWGERNYHPGKKAGGTTVITIFSFWNIWPPPLNHPDRLALQT